MITGKPIYDVPILSMTAGILGNCSRVSDAGIREQSRIRRYSIPYSEVRDIKRVLKSSFSHEKIASSSLCARAGPQRLSRQNIRAQHLAMSYSDLKRNTLLLCVMSFVVDRRHILNMVCCLS